MDKEQGSRREVRMYQRFLKLWPKFKLKMLQRPKWQEYMGLSPREAHELGEAHRRIGR